MFTLQVRATQLTIYTRLHGHQASGSPAAGGHNEQDGKQFDGWAARKHSMLQTFLIQLMAQIAARLKGSA
ncbi:hypothetical protein [Plastoroseomonas hellenica]|uniref:hypothetical protein n=1 Tax=Plastoroseomonas hellenica TaxID=2687306 RepID=UPI001BA531E2|nr:hypothetical protein [Plastoroseomonas hellenica]MBR0642930.1 hypothetical protein [Plastoroseomonas hellenica]